MMYAIGAILAVGLVLLVVSLINGGGGEGVCPPGMVWDAQHGHCH